MSHLDRFTEDQRNLLIALPYRVGLWVSSSDKAGGDDADDAEMQALKIIVTGFAEDFLKSEFVQVMMEETVSHQSEWPQWGSNLDEVPAECKRAVDILSECLERKELASFKLNLMEIATDVAMAYREFDHHGNLSFRLKVYSRVLLERMQSALTGKRARTLDQLMNISESEQKALDALARALDLGNARPRSIGAGSIAA